MVTLLQTQFRQRTFQIWTPSQRTINFQWRLILVNFCLNNVVLIMVNITRAPLVVGCMRLIFYIDDWCSFWEAARQLLIMASSPIGSTLSRDALG
jgi:hypothetical protein